jgi:hypothetical protein
VSHDEVNLGEKGMMALTTKAHHLLNSAQQEAEHELEAIELATAAIGGCEGLEGGFISFDQHALMLSIITFCFETRIPSPFHEKVKRT